MAANTSLTREQAAALLKGEALVCPSCKAKPLAPRYRHKRQNVEYKCPVCGAIYHPCKLI